jgi:hypothetical protein
MKIDLYTKAVLTVIAVCLVWMCVNGATPVVGAQTARPEPTPVMLVDAKGTPLYTADGLRVTIGPRVLPVTVSNTSLPVTIGNPFLQVQVMREPPTQRPVP